MPNVASVTEPTVVPSTRAVSIWDCNGGANQKWTLNANGTLVGTQSGLCLAPAGNATAAGTAVVLATCSTATTQQWVRLV